MHEQGNKKTILLTNHYQGEPLELLRELTEGYCLTVLEESTRDCLIRHIPSADYLLVSGRLQIDKTVLEHAGKLQMIQRTGTGLDNLDLAEITKRKIPLYVNKGINSNSVAEYTLLLMLGCLRRISSMYKNMEHGIWKKQEFGILTSELSGKTIGLIGLGKIGKRVAELLAPFHAKIFYYSRRRCGETEKELGIQYMDFDELLRAADILSLHCPLTKDTQGMIGKEELSCMKQGSVLINTARGGLVDMEALTAALRERKIGFAGLDVFDQEPLPVEHPVRSVDNAILSPHIAGITKESFYGMLRGAVQNIKLFDSGRQREIEMFRVG